MSNTREYRFDNETRTLAEQLLDPSRSNAALLELLGRGKQSVPALIEFLRTSRPSTVSEGRVLAVEGLSILKGSEALDVLIEVATRELAAILDPVVRLAEESVSSAAARALGDLEDPRARETLIRLLAGKPLLGVAEALEKLKDERAIPGLIVWLEDDFVAEAAGRAIVAIGPTAVPHLLESLNHMRMIQGAETRPSQRRRARVLQLLEALAEPSKMAVVAGCLEDSAECVRWNAAQALVRRGTGALRQYALEVALEFLDSADNQIRADCEELLKSNFEIARKRIEQEVLLRRQLDEASRPLEVRESGLEILERIRREGLRRVQSGVKP
jgi:HEAT repeat protein